MLDNAPDDAIEEILDPSEVAALAAREDASWEEEIEHIEGSQTRLHPSDVPEETGRKTGRA